MLRKSLIWLTLPSLLVSCAQFYTQQDLSKLKLLNQGMTQEQVLAIMGEPVKVELESDSKAFYYCSTGYKADEFAAVIFKDDKVVATKNYFVTMADVGGASGDCTHFVKSVDLKQPDIVQEIRYR